MAVTVQHPTYGLIEFPDGYTEAQINNALIDLDAREGEQYGIGETLFRAAERGLTSTARGIEQMATGDIDQGISLSDTSDFEKERELRIMLQQNPISGYSALLLGSLADPVTLPFAWTKLLKSANIVAQATSRSAAGGATGGLLEPTYEEFGDSSVLNIMAGAGLGAGIGAVAGKVLQRVSEGPSVKVEGDEEGIVVPQSIREDGKLKDEVFSAIDDVELASIEARVGQSLQETGAIDDVQKLAEGLPRRQLADVPTPEARAFNPVVKLKEELIPLAARALPRKEVQTLQNSLNVLNNQVAKAQKIVDARKTVAAKERAQATVDKIVAQQQKVQTKLTEAKEAANAQRYINTIDAGRIDKLPQLQKTRLAALQQEAGADLNAVNVAARQEAQKLPEPIEAEVNALNARVAERVNPIEYKPVTPRIPLGLDPLPGVGATGTRPSAQFAATSPDAPGEDAVRRAMTQTKRVEPTPDRGGMMIQGATEPQIKFHSRLQADSSEQLIRLRNEQVYQGMPTNRYSWANVSNAAVEVEGRILNDYDDLVSFLADNEQNILKAVELEVLAPLFIEAQRRLWDSYSILQGLKREGRINSDDGVRAMQDLQFYNLIGNIYDAQTTQVSNLMTQFRKMKPALARQEKQQKLGKQIDQIMFGVTC